jgi:hypothetical protein
VIVVAPPRAGGRLLAQRLATVAGGRPIHHAPRNVLSVSVIAERHPAASFVYVHREPAEVLALMLAGWRSRQAVTHPELVGWAGPPWSFLLVPRWRELNGLPLPEIVVGQWVQTMEVLVEALERLAPARWCVIAHRSLTGADGAEVSRVSRFLGLAAAGPPGRDLRLPAPPETLTAELAPYLPRTERLAARSRDWLAAA